MFDVSPYTQPVTPQQHHWVKQQRVALGDQPWIGAMGIALMALAALGILALAIPLIAAGNAGGWVVLALALIGPGIWIYFLADTGATSLWERNALFAAANRLSYYHGELSPDLPSMVFAARRTAAVVSDRFQGTGATPFVEAGDYRWECGRNLENMPRRASSKYVAFRLPQLVPSVLLEVRALGRNASSLLLAPRISLGPAFDAAYDISAPQGYPTDVLHLLDPQVQQVILAQFQGCDVEFTHDLLIVHVGERFRIGDQQFWCWADQIQVALLPLLEPMRRQNP